MRIIIDTRTFIALLLDTGSTHSFINSAAVDAFGLAPVSSMSMGHGGQQGQSSLVSAYVVESPLPLTATTSGLTASHFHLAA